MFVSSRTVGFSTNSGKLQQDGVYNNKTMSLESRKKISFHEKLKLLNSVIKELLGSKIFQWGGVI